MIKIGLNSDSFYRHLLKYTQLFSQISESVINFLLVWNTNSTFGEYILNFVRMDCDNLELVSKSPNRYKMIVFLFLNYLLPILRTALSLLLKKFNFRYSEKIENFIKNINTLKIILDLLYKLAFLFSKDFIYYNFIDHLLGLILVNFGSNDNFSDKFLHIGKQINLFLLYMMIRFGEWYYQKEEKQESNIVEIEKPNISIGAKQNKCPMCKINTHSIANPKALKCCGYVICENCILSHLKIKNRCPVCQNLINKENSIVNIYN